MSCGEIDEIVLGEAGKISIGRAQLAGLTS